MKKLILVICAALLFTSCAQNIEYTLKDSSSSEIAGQMLYITSWLGYEDGIGLDTFSQRFIEAHKVTSNSYVTWDNISYDIIDFQYQGHAYVGKAGTPSEDVVQEIIVGRVNLDNNNIIANDDSYITVVFYITDRIKAEEIYNDIVTYFRENEIEVHDHHRTDEYWHASYMEDNQDRYQDFIVMEAEGSGYTMTLTNYN